LSLAFFLWPPCPRFFPFALDFFSGYFLCFLSSEMREKNSGSSLLPLSIQELPPRIGFLDFIKFLHTAISPLLFPCRFSPNLSIQVIVKGSFLFLGRAFCSASALLDYYFNKRVLQGSALFRSGLILLLYVPFPRFGILLSAYPPYPDFLLRTLSFFFLVYCPRDEFFSLFLCFPVPVFDRPFFLRDWTSNFTVYLTGRSIFGRFTPFPPCWYTEFLFFPFVPLISLFHQWDAFSLVFICFDLQSPAHHSRSIPPL